MWDSSTCSRAPVSKGSWHQRIKSVSIQCRLRAFHLSHRSSLWPHVTLLKWLRLPHSPAKTLTTAAASDQQTGRGGTIHTLWWERTQVLSVQHEILTLGYKIRFKHVIMLSFTTIMRWLYFQYTVVLFKSFDQMKNFKFSLRLFSFLQYNFSLLVLSILASPTSVMLN